MPFLKMISSSLRSCCVPTSVHVPPISSDLRFSVASCVFHEIARATHQITVVSGVFPCTDDDWKDNRLQMPGLAESDWPGQNHSRGGGVVIFG